MRFHKLSAERLRRLLAQVVATSGSMTLLPSFRGG